MSLPLRIQKELIIYLLSYNKELVEDTNNCPKICEAFEAGEITTEDLEYEIDNLRHFLLSSI